MQKYGRKISFPTRDIQSSTRGNEVLKAEALLMLCDHFKSVNESFLVEANEDFPDVLMIKANGPNQVSSVAKGIGKFKDKFCKL